MSTHSRAIADALEREARAREGLLDASILQAVVEVAAERGIFAPHDVAKLVDRESLVLDDEGRPLNVREAVDAVIEDLPLLGDMEWHRLQLEQRRKSERERSRVEARVRAHPNRIGTGPRYAPPRRWAS